MNKLLNRYIIFFVTYLITVLSLNAAQNSSFSAEAASESSVRCAPELKKHFQALLKIPEAKAIIEKIRQEGSFQIIVESTGLTRRFGAFWDPNRRIICIDASSDLSGGEVIGSLLFELHNASVNLQFDHLDKLAAGGKITKEHYIESMEYIEYLNSLSTSKIASTGIRMGVLPLEARLPTYPNFKEHFKAQKSSGHSACFARNYDMCQRDNKSSDRRF